MTAVRRAWLIVGSLVTVGVLAVGTFNLVGLLAQGDRTDQRTFAATSIDSLDVDIENGPVEVVGADVDTIRVEAQISDGLRPTKYSAVVRGTTLLVSGQCPFIVPTSCDAAVRITVPRALPVVIDADDGEVTLRHLEGPIQVASNNGLLRLDDLGGDLTTEVTNGRTVGTALRSAVVEASGVNGRLSLTFAEPPTTVRATAINGHVEIVLPDTPDAYRVAVDSHNGSTDAPVRTDPSSDRSIRAGTSNGTVTVRYPDG